MMRRNVGCVGKSTKCFFLRMMVMGCALFMTWTSEAQVSEDVYAKDYVIDPAKKGDLSIEVDNISFFRNHENMVRGKNMQYAKGYSLPGFWLQAKGVYQPRGNVKFELGVHALRYWGATYYPSMAYVDIPEWKGDQYQHGFHVLPWLRAQIDFNEHITLVMGNVYGGANHRLIEPLYNPELNLTCDPEAGLQVLFNSKVFDFDMWLNWESFIFRNDGHQEAFTFGLSSRFKLNDEASKTHFYIPIQGVARHRGGEIDTLFANETLMNFAVGVGMEWHPDLPVLQRVQLEADMLGFTQQAGTAYPYDSGSAFHVKAAAKLKDFSVDLSYTRSHKFVPIYGNPFYGSVSAIDHQNVLKDPSLLTFGADYTYRVFKGVDLGIDVDLYNHLPCKQRVDGVISDRAFTSTLSAGIYLRVNPSFLIKHW